MSTLNLFDATDSLLGYLYQCRYALLLLIERGKLTPSVEMSIERFDDVAFEQNGNPVEAIQTKHHLGQIRNLTDSSVDLWKTLRVWSEGVTNGTFDLTEIVLTIVTTATAPSGSIASLLRQDARDEATALQRLVNVVKTSTNKENASGYDAYCKLSTDQKKALISCIYVYDNAPNIQNVLPQIKNHLILSAPRNQVDNFVSTLEGWWFNTVVRHLMGQDSGTISGHALDTKMDDIRQQFQRDNLPLDFCIAAPPVASDVAKDQRTFVKQLRIISAHEVTISKAICDHYKSSGQRAQWIRQDLLLLDDVERYDRKLTDEWERNFARIAEDLGDNPSNEHEIKAGRDMYHDLQEKSIYIRSSCTEPVIMRGSYHDLADNMKVGWHPRYNNLLKEEK